MTLQNSPGAYDSRWFIWTIVLLIVLGTTVTTYSMLTVAEEDTNASLSVLPVHAPVRAHNR